MTATRFLYYWLVFDKNDLQREYLRDQLFLQKSFIEDNEATKLRGYENLSHFGFQPLK